MRVDPEKERAKAWHLRLEGHSLSEIARMLGVSAMTVHRDVKWCQENLPGAYEGAAQLREMSLQRLDRQYRQLEPLRESGDVPAHRVSVQIMDTQAKLTGAYAPTQVQATVSVSPAFASALEALATEVDQEAAQIIEGEVVEAEGY